MRVEKRAWEQAWERAWERVWVEKSDQGGKLAESPEFAVRVAVTGYTNDAVTVAFTIAGNVTLAITVTVIAVVHRHCHGQSLVQGWG